MSRSYPALQIVWPIPDDDTSGRAIALLTDFNATVFEETAGGVCAFFQSVADRDAGALALAEADTSASLAPLMVPDESWAERSQAALTPIRAGAIVVRPPWAAPEVHGEQTITITIQPSMGFGTGHHQSTRLCLWGLQRVPVRDAVTIDVGCGSGVLAIAAWKLGASRVAGLDADRDALTSAAENLGLNGATGIVELDYLEVEPESAPPTGVRAGVITANLSGALVERLAPLFARWLTPAGALVTSGFQQHEESSVAEALAHAGLRVVDRLAEDDWTAFIATPTSSTTP